jgi:hypothetical protein
LRAQFFSERKNRNCFAFLDLLDNADHDFAHGRRQIDSGSVRSDESCRAVVRERPVESGCLFNLALIARRELNRFGYRFHRSPFASFGHTNATGPILRLFCGILSITIDTNSTSRPIPIERIHLFPGLQCFLFFFFALAQRAFAAFCAI